MRFEWNEQKNISNLQKHGLAFENAVSLFDGSAPLLIELDDRIDYGEDRWIGIGLLRNHIVVVVFVELTSDTIRLISARRANHYERKRYRETFGI